MNRRTQLLCAWSGPFFMLLFFVGFTVIARFCPPPSPADSADKVAAYYAEHADRIRIGMLLTMASSAFLVPWVAAITVQMKRMVGPSHALAYTQLAAGSLVALEILFPTMFWTAAAFRAGRDPGDIQLLNDIGWIPFVMAWSPPLVHNLSLGVAILGDRSRTPVFPRWAGQLNLALAVLLLPAGALAFTKTGPFAWDGAVSWWLTITLFFTFWVVMTVLLIRAIKQESAEVPDVPERVLVTA